MITGCGTLITGWGALFVDVLVLWTALLLIRAPESEL
jgi:hypothetical protein